MRSNWIIPKVTVLLWIPIGPFGEGDEEQVFVQRVIPDTDTIYIRLSSNGQRFVEAVTPLTCISNTYVHAYMYIKPYPH